MFRKIFTDEFKFKLGFGSIVGFGCGLPMLGAIFLTLALVGAFGVVIRDSASMFTGINVMSFSPVTGFAQEAADVKPIYVYGLDKLSDAIIVVGAQPDTEMEGRFLLFGNALIIAKGDEQNRMRGQATIIELYPGDNLELSRYSVDGEGNFVTYMVCDEYGRCPVPAGNQFLAKLD